jgi:hypothetical protein
VTSHYRELYAAKKSKKLVIINTVMTITEFLQTWIPLTVGILSIITVGGTLIYKLNKRFINLLREQVANLIKEFKPNGGSSLKDQVNRLESGHNEVEKDIKDLKKDLSDVRKDNLRLENKLDKMFDTLLKVIDKFNK